MKPKTFHGGADEERSKILRKLVRERNAAYANKQTYTGVVLDGIIAFVKERVERNKAKKGGL